MNEAEGLAVAHIKQLSQKPLPLGGVEALEVAPCIT